MRNLKKILALVLALVMSLSLMATAGAADFSDKDQITDKYNTAIEVLNGLEVFQGYDNGATFKPQGDITRAEVAAIIYRIATGDVSDSQKDIYSGWGLFTDVADGSWYAGYVNYCANAGYIKGRGNKIFDPNGKVTGYEALAMILRAIGYDKNNEFSGSNWQVRTASIAKQRHITNNITDTLLGGPATREVVAEILFQAILVPTVTFNTNTLSYTENATSLGYDILKLEAIEGVVVANEYANLYDTKVIKADTTDFEVNGNVRTLDIGSDLNDMGESRLAYVVGSKVLALGDSGHNTVFDNETGAKVDISTASKFNSVSGLTADDNTEYYVNFGYEGYYTSNYRIEYEVTFNTKAAEDAFDKYAGTNISKIAATTNTKIDEIDMVVTGRTGTGRTETIKKGDATDYATVLTEANYPVTYSKIIPAGKTLSQNDVDVIAGIFGIADDNNQSLGITGNVYGGSNSQDRNKDLSDTISYKAFKDEYINEELYKKSWGKSDNGEWVKIIDNNADGKAEYAFLTQFSLDKALKTYTKGSSEYIEYYDLDLVNGPKAKYMEEIKVDDVVLTATIDGQALIWKADFVESDVTIIDMKNQKITTSAGETYSQSGIDNQTLMDETITLMDDDVNYRIYLDEYGYARAYEPVEGTRYALLTELYYGYEQNGRYVTSNDLTVELKAGDEAMAEYKVNNKAGNDFVLNFSNNTGAKNWANLHTVLNVASYAWYADAYNVVVDGYGNVSNRIVLQPAVEHLGLAEKSDAAADIFRNATTNVARYVTTTDGQVRITSAAQYAYNTDGTQKFVSGTTTPVYDVDYVQLDTTKSIAAGQELYPMFGSAHAGKNVDTVHSTEFYVVTAKRVLHYTDYVNMPAIPADMIRAAYAVARNTSADANKNDYWVADVVVIEAPDYVGAYDNVALLFNLTFLNNTLANQRMAGVRVVEGLTSAIDETAVTMIPNGSTWDNRWNGYGFYEISNPTKNDDGTVSAGISQITTDKADRSKAGYNDHGVYAGTIDQVTRVNTDGGYITAKYTDASGNVINRVLHIDNNGFWAVLSSNANGSNAYGENLLRSSYNREQIKAGDEIIWVEDGKGNVSFIVDLTYTSGSAKAPAWLASKATGIYGDILAEEASVYAEKSASIWNVKVMGQPVVFNGNVGSVTLTQTQALAAVSATLPKLEVGSSNPSYKAGANGAQEADIYAIGWDATGTQLGWQYVNGAEDKGNNESGSFATLASIRSGANLQWTIRIRPYDLANMSESTYTINITVLPAEDDANLKSLSVKGVKVDLDKYTLVTEGTTTYRVYNVTVPYANNNDTSKKQISYTKATNAVVTVYDFTNWGTANGTYNKTPSTADGTAFTNTDLYKTDSFKIQSVAENGASQIFYKINVTMEQGVKLTVDGGTYGIMVDTTPVDLGEDIMVDTTGNLVIKPDMRTAADSTLFTGVTIKYGAVSKTIAAVGNTVTIPAADLQAARNSTGNEMKITVNFEAGVFFKAANGGFWIGNTWVTRDGVAFSYADAYTLTIENDYTLQSAGGLGYTGGPKTFTLTGITKGQTYTIDVGRNV